MEKLTGNMEIYEAGRSVPKEAQKSFTNGSFSGTDINPMWRIKKLTELFGPAGIGWYTEIIDKRAETYGDTVMAIVDINLYIKVGDEWSKPIYGTGGNQLVQATRSGARPSDEGYKKAYTDALSIACKALGIGADVWYSADPTAVDPTSKYAAQYTQTEPASANPVKPAKAAVSTVETSSSLICPECGKAITPYIKGGSIVYTAEQIAEMNQKRFGMRLCSACSLKRRNAS